MLTVMDRYIKLFLDDKEMRLEYEEEKQRAKSMPGFGELSDLEYYLFDDNSIVHLQPFMKPPEQLQKAQRLHFKSTLIRYLIEEASVSVQWKLMKSCRYLAKSFPSIICHHLRLAKWVRVSSYYSQSLKLSDEATDNNKFTKLHITNHLYVYISDPWKLHTMIPKLYRCSARFVVIRDQNLTWSDAKFCLNDSVEKLKLWNNNVVKVDGTLASIYQVLELVPNAYELKLVYKFFSLYKFIHFSVLKCQRIHLM